MAGAYPSGMPAWEETDLNNLAAQGLLSGVSPLVLAGIAQNESGFENKGAGINSIGDGGFFGLQENGTYSYQGKSFTDTPSELLDPSSASFEQQAQTSALDIARLLASKGSLQGALATYTGGGPNNGDYVDATNILGDSPVSSAAQYPVTGTGAAAPTTTTTSSGGSGSGGSTPSSTVAVPGWLSFLGVTSSDTGSLLARVLLIIVALILLAVGVDKLLSTDSPSDIIMGAPGSVSGAASSAGGAASSAVNGSPEPSRAPGANRERSGGNPSKGRSLPMEATEAAVGA